LLTLLVNRVSPLTGTKTLWRDRPKDAGDPKPDELPLLRSSSDIAWGLWNRGSNNMKNPNVKNIQKIFSMNIVNEETKMIMIRALGSVKVPEGEPKIFQPPAWPGATFDLSSGEEDGVAGRALLGM
jgi:hypothetical protein